MPARQYIVYFQPDSVGVANGSTFGCFLVIDSFHALAQYAAFRKNCTLQLIMDLINELLFGFSNDKFIGSRLLILMLHSLSNLWHFILNCYVCNCSVMVLCSAYFALFQLVRFLPCLRHILQRCYTRNAPLFTMVSIQSC